MSGSFTCLRVRLWAFFQPLRARSVVLGFVRRQKGRRFSFLIIAGVGGRPLELFSGFAQPGKNEGRRQTLESDL